MILPGIPTVSSPPADPFATSVWLTVPKTSSVLEKASWIWVTPPGSPPSTPAGASPGTVHLIRVWNLRELPRDAHIAFRVDNSCRVRVNGQLVGGSDDWNKPADLDIVKALRAGENRIEVEATNGAGDAGQANPAGVLLAAEATMPSGEKTTLTSDASWTSADGTVTVLGGYTTAPWNLRPVSVPAPAFRREFNLRGKVVKATARVIGLGQFDLYANGKRQGDGELNGPWSQYDKTLYWQEFDLTKSLKAGRNALGVELGNSFYRVEVPPPGRHTKGDAMPDFSGDAPYLLAAVVDVDYADGSHERIVTDRDWRFGPSPLRPVPRLRGRGLRRPHRRSELGDARLRGERLAIPRHRENPQGRTPPDGLAPVQSRPELEADRDPQPEARRLVLHLPAERDGDRALPRGKGHAARTVKFKPSEVITPEGEVEQLNLWGNESSGSYTLRGGDAETREWRFFFHGFRYVEITGAVPAGKPNPQNLPVLESLEMVHVRTDNTQVGKFHSSSDLYDRTHNLVDWAVRSNMAYYLSDCPQREKLGWLECAHLLFPTIAYRYDVRDWYHKITRDIRDIQLPDGRITNVAPRLLHAPHRQPLQVHDRVGLGGSAGSVAGVPVVWRPSLPDGELPP